MLDKSDVLIDDYEINNITDFAKIYLKKQLNFESTLCRQNHPENDYFQSSEKVNHKWFRVSCSYHLGCNYL